MLFEKGEAQKYVTPLLDVFKARNKIVHGEKAFTDVPVKTRLSAGAFARKCVIKVLSDPALYKVFSSDEDTVRRFFKEMGE